jgi:SAM-dependent methyltransferase
MFEIEAQKANETIGETADQKYQRHVDADSGYKCIHLGINDFIQQLQFVVKELHLTSTQISKIKFLDVGCGVGQKVFLASCFGFDAFGLELRKELIEAGRGLFSKLNADYIFRQYGSCRCDRDFFIQGNALTYTGYNQFDILYFYCPLHKNELEIELEKKLAQDAKPGTIILANLPKYFYHYDEPCKAPEGWQRLIDSTGGLVYQKI